MKKVTRLCLFFLLVNTALLAQKYNLTGTLLADDTSEPLVSATIMLLNPTDSSLINFGRSESNGTFVIRGLNTKDPYLLRITFLSYELYDQQIPAGVDKNIYDVGTIRMKPASLTLGEAVVTGEHIPVQIKKDTIEFNANAFKTQPNADVESLLKQLPGVEIESDGSIKAQGQDVQRVFVDGKEFFGNDPKIATKNLPARAIDKVQVYDRKSDQATFSGIDDGVREKAINLTLKKDHKKGLFGTVSGGYGNDDRFEGRISLNRFREDQQLSLIGMGNNVNRSGFSFQDYMSFTGGARGLGGGGRGSVQITVGGGGSGGGGLPLDFGNSNTGFTRTWAGGLNYNNEWNKKTKLNLSYFLNSSNREVDRLLNRENFLSNGSFKTNENSFGTSLNESHRLNLTLEHDIDSSSNIKFTSNMGYSKTDQNSEANSEAFGLEDIIQNTGDRINYSNGLGMNWNNNLLYRLKLGKPGRTLSANLTFGLNDSERDAELESVNKYYDGGALFRTDSIMQFSNQLGNTLSLGGNASYTEPLGKRRYLELNYAFNQNQNDQDYEVFDVNNGEEQFNDQLSNKFDNTTQYHRGGANFRKNATDYNFSFGAQVQQTILDGNLILQDVEINRSFTNFLPNAHFNYDFTSATRTSLDYTTNVNEPSIEQLSPLVDNSDPLNISIGNPNLRPEYAHRISTNFNTFNAFTQVNLFVFLNYVYTQNSISNAQWIDDNFVRTTQAVNVDNSHRFNSSFNFGFPIKRPNLRASFNPNFTWSKGFSLINDVENETKRINLRNGVRLFYRYKEMLNASAGGSLSYNQTHYSLQSSQNQDFINQTYDADFNLNLPFGLSFGSSLNYTIYNSINDDSADQSVPLWNASISQFILNKRGEIKFAVNDLLNRNVGINRVADVNYYQEEITRSLGRYYMVSFTYSLQQLGVGGGPIIRMHN